MTNRKSAVCAFQSASDEQITLPLSPHLKSGAQKRKVAAVFRIKVELSRRQFATNFICAKSFSDSILRHLLAYLTLHKWLVGTPPSTGHFRPK